ncbi:C-C motif chemokine 5-like [Notolabrus celidotus]|uniref:C-C motif chemokine 5-like n=1 Tax=Notolabrus celidotus TaxID=1203425 RepID=UPI00149077C9|nr:C-C motif chemokine 5-like [Notolabrus celidotus]
MIMKMMKNPIILVTCVLLFAALTVLASPSVFGPDKCCFEFVPGPLPKKGVLRYKYTNNQCSKRGVLLEMKNKHTYCADPSVKWVKEAMAAHDSK